MQDSRPTIPEPSEPDDHDDAVWSMLERQRRDVPVSPDFARRTAAHARSLPQDAGHPQAGKILAFPVRAIAAAAAVVCASLLLFWGPDQSVNTAGTSPTPDRPDQTTEPSMAEPVMAEVEPWEWELEEVNLIDQLVAHNDPANLTDAELEFLLF